MLPTEHRKLGCLLTSSRGGRGQHCCDRDMANNPGALGSSACPVPGPDGVIHLQKAMGKGPKLALMPQRWHHSVLLLLLSWESIPGPVLPTLPSASDCHRKRPMLKCGISKQQEFLSPYFPAGLGAVHC